MQSFVGESVIISAVLAVQLRAVSNVDVVVYGSRADRAVEHLLMVADRLNILRQTLMEVPTVGLSAAVADDHASMDWLTAVDASLTSVLPVFAVPLPPFNAVFDTLIAPAFSCTRNYSSSGG